MSFDFKRSRNIALQVGSRLRPLTRATELAMLTEGTASIILKAS